MNSYHLARLGSLVAGGGITWAAYTATRDVAFDPGFLETTFRNVVMQTGPLEVCGIGILIWILAKWRSSVAH